MKINGKITVISAPSWNDKALEIAKSEIEALSIRRFGTESQSCTAKIIENTTLPSFQVESKDGCIIIEAPNAVEAMYGVYDFAEKYLGFYFWAPGEDLLNAKGPVEIQDGMLIPAKAPLLSIRGFVQEFPFDDKSPLLADWMAKNKLNYLNVWMAEYDKLSQKGRHDFLDRGIEVQSGHHNFNYWIPSAKYHNTHPEYFAEIDGVRIKPSSGQNVLLQSEQLCTTNPGLRKEIVKNMLQYCEDNPEIKTVALIPNDGFGWCECKECSKFYDKNNMGDLYSVSSHVYKADKIYHDMLADVARQLGEKRPDLMLNFCAYVNYCRPAEGFKLTSNLSVSLATYWRCINHRIDEACCPINSHYADDLKAWANVKEGGKIIVYEYFMGVNFYISFPMIHFHDVFKEVDYYSKNDIDGLMTQFHLPHWSVYGVNFRAMADAMRGEEEEFSVTRMLTALFGKDADEAAALYAAMRDMLEKAGPCHIPYPYSILSRSNVGQYENLLDMAKKLRDKQSSNALRNDIVIWCEYMLRFKKLFDRYHEKNDVTVQDVEDFLAWIHSHKDCHVFVHPKFDGLLGAWCDAIRNGTPWLHYNLDWEDEYIRKHMRVLNGLPE